MRALSAFAHASCSSESKFVSANPGGCPFSELGVTSSFVIAGLFPSMPGAWLSTCVSADERRRNRSTFIGTLADPALSASSDDTEDSARSTPLGILGRLPRAGTASYVGLGCAADDASIRPSSDSCVLVVVSCVLALAPDCIFSERQCGVLMGSCGQAARVYSGHSQRPFSS